MSRLKLIDADLLISIIKAARQLQPVPPANQDLVLSSNAEQEMSRILQQPSTEENNKKYMSELNKYALHLNKYQEQPDSSTVSTVPANTAERPVQPTETPPPTESPPLAPFRMFDDIVGRTGPRERKRMLTILDRLTSPESNLTWNSSYQIMDNGVPIEGSNLFDLLKSITGERKKLPPTPGLSRFGYHLHQLNVPQHTAGTVNAQRILQTGQVDQSLDPLMAHDGTFRPAKRKRTAPTPPVANAKSKRKRTSIYSSKISRWV